MPKQESVQPFLQSLYGINQKESETFDRMCLLSRRRGERGVRFVQAGCVKSSEHTILGWELVRSEDSTHPTPTRGV